ncbi:MAG: hypothetical protein ACLUDU_17060 [Butyricimonas faecihominis]
MKGKYKVEDIQEEHTDAVCIARVGGWVYIPSVLFKNHLQST